MQKIIAIFICFLPFGSVKADGYPFDHLTNEVIGANFRLPLTDAQQTEVASTGFISFTKEQLVLLHLVYPKIPVKLRVIAATFNDGLDERDINPVDCIWTKPDEVAITWSEKSDEGDYSFDSGDKMFDSAEIRISPTGLLYHLGKEIGIEKAFEIVRTAKRPEGSPATESPTIRITQPPRFRSSYEEEMASNKKVADIFTALSKYGESVGVSVHPFW